jgi:hypothetical protein
MDALARNRERDDEGLTPMTCHAVAGRIEVFDVNQDLGGLGVLCG